MEPIIDDTLHESGQGLTNARFAGFWIRVGATVIDGLILAPVTVLGVLNSIDYKSPWIMVIVAVMAFCYKPYMEWQFSDTFGKRILKIKLVNAQGNNISKEQAFNRYGPWVISFIITMGINISLYVSEEFYNVYTVVDLGELMKTMPLYNVSSIYSIIFMVIIGSVGGDKLKQGIHDKIAKTFCIYK